MVLLASSNEVQSMYMPAWADNQAKLCSAVMNLEAKSENAKMLALNRLTLWLDKDHDADLSETIEFISDLARAPNNIALFHKHHIKTPLQRDKRWCGKCSAAQKQA